ncbi:MAG: hypothetical protein R6X08_05245 [Desulfosalsimonadaceae bacterium]
MEPLSKKQVIDAACERLETLICGLDFIDAVEIRREVRQNTGPDFAAEVLGSGIRQVLLVETRIKGEPRLAREAANSLLAAMRYWSHACPVFVAPWISEAAAAVCREKQVSYLDLAGNCHICFGTVFIHTAGYKNPYRQKRGLKSLARPKSAAVLRVLLNQPRRRWRVLDLAREAGVSLGLVSNIKQILKDKEFIDPRAKAIIPTQPDKLLEQWIASASPADSVLLYKADMDFIEIENRLAEESRKNDRQCAFTGLSGAVHLASGIGYYRQVQAYVSGREELEVPGFEPAEKPEKANVAVIHTLDRGVFHGSRQVIPTSRLQYCRPSEKTVKAIESQLQTRIRIVSAVQIYFDLRVRFPECAKEAEKIGKQVLEPSW